MRLTIDPKADALYLRLNEEQIVDSEQVSSGVVLDYDAQDNVVGAEMLNLSRRDTITAMNPPITPGEILLEEYLKPMGISQNAMARAIRVPPRAVNEIVLGRRSITLAMSIRFGAFFGQSDDFWYGLQKECDFRAPAGSHALFTSDPSANR